MSLDTDRDSKEMVCRPLKIVGSRLGLRNCVEFMEARRLCLAWLCICLALSIPLIIAVVCVGALLASPNGELPLWYEVSTCANASDALTVSGYGGEEPASTSLATEAYTRSYWIQHGRVPSPNELVGSACPVAAREPGPFDITLEKDDGYRRPEHC